MNVLHVIDSGGLYGAENMLLDLAAEQREMGHRPMIASIGERGIREKAIESEAKRRGIRVERFRMRPGINYSGAMEILRFAWEADIDLLHSHGYKGNILLGTIPRPWRRLPLLATIHGYTSLDRLTRMKIYEWLDACLLRLLDGVVLVDAAMRQHPLLRDRSGVRFQVVNNGIRGSVPAEGSCPGDDPGLIEFCRSGFTIGAIGRLSPEKGFQHLIEALARVRQEGVDARLLLIGEGDEREHLQELIGRLQLQERVALAGYRREARRYLPLLQLFLLPSLTEGLPITVLEAMQGGIPVLATRVGAVPEILEQGRAGMLVAPGSAKELAEGILTFHRHPELGPELAARARQRVKNYSSRRMAAQYEQIYRELLDGEVALYA